MIPPKSGPSRFAIAVVDAIIVAYKAYFEVGTISGKMTKVMA
jgi:hypothetical protein